MPQMSRGGKFIFRKSVVHESGQIQIPAQAMEEYHITADKRGYLHTGSKSTGGFCVTRRGLLEPSKLGHILTDNHRLFCHEMSFGTGPPANDILQVFALRFQPDGVSFSGPQLQLPAVAVLGLVLVLVHPDFTVIC